MIQHDGWIPLPIVDTSCRCWLPQLPFQITIFLHGCCCHRRHLCHPFATKPYTHSVDGMCVVAPYCTLWRKQAIAEGEKDKETKIKRFKHLVALVCSVLFIIAFNLNRIFRSQVPRWIPIKLMRGHAILECSFEPCIEQRLITHTNNLILNSWLVFISHIFGTASAHGWSKIH